MKTMASCSTLLGMAVIAFALAFKIESAAQPTGTKKVLPKQADPLSVAEALKRFQVGEGLEITPVLTEPAVKQPVFLNFDERGRMWVVQYLQYPHPAGLTMLSRDKYWRVVYDKVPPPPPHHFPGKDKITIHEDTDGDGVFDKHATFVEGLNITTAVERGRGGVWVLNPPYLLFYPDKNNDDVPDGDPEVHLEGFGLEDSHSVTNSLRWGPDGWLYAAQGSTVSGNIKRPGDKQAVHSMGQLIWRYHPETRRYEIFAEGGGNAFGVEIDSKGRVYSGHNGGDTRGFHYVQGGYYQKGFSKHGSLTNPYTFGYFPFMRHAKVQRFTHTFVLYEGGTLPGRYHGKLFAANPVQSEVVLSQIRPDGSSFQTQDLEKAIASTDFWFRPVDIKTGPDGALYVADWYDPHAAHLRHHEGEMDRDRGRIYRLQAKDAKPSRPIDLTKLSTRELVKLLEHDNRWYRQTALRVIGDRKDRSVIPLLSQSVKNSTGQFALEALWALNLSGGLDESISLQTLDHADPYVRLWTVRLLGDRTGWARGVTPAEAKKLAELAARESHLEVRSQLACSARRLPADTTLAILRPLLARNEDVDDIHIPLLLWWALEAKAESDRDQVVHLFEDSELWRRPLVDKHILERLMRRYAQAGSRKNLLTCAKLLQLAPGPDQAKRLLAGFEQAFAGRPLANLPEELVKALAQHGGGSLSLRVRLGETKAVDQALQTIADEKQKLEQRLGLVKTLAEVPQTRCVPVLLQVIAQAGDPALRQAAISALAPYDDPKVAVKMIELHETLPAEVRSVAQSLLASRKDWAQRLLEAVDGGKIKRDGISTEVLRRMTMLRDERIQQLVGKHWGKIQGATTADMQKKIAHWQQAVAGGNGSPYPGKKLFEASCAKCHTLFGRGGFIGPDLTAYKRDDIANVLLHIVNPSAEIREGFETYLVLTDDGRALTGFLFDQDNQIVVLRSADGQDISIPRTRIEEMKAIPQSLMPEGLLDPLSEQQVRDLFAYFRSSQPLND